jgi:hypothetical protein
MTVRPDIYTLARRVIDRCGSEAAAYAETRMLESLFDEDHRGAGAWLAIGNAIEDLERLPPPGRRH